MTMQEDTYEIVYIPDKSLILPNQQPTVNMFASVIEPKHANAFVRRLNKIAPLENLRHVKRVQKKRLEEGKFHLSVILCPACEDGNQLDSVPSHIVELIDSYQLSAFITKVGVCKYAASSKEEWVEQCKLWPTSYHPPTYNIDGIAGFSKEESQSISSFMRLAVELANSGDGHVVNAAVVVDPSVKLVLASACDQTCSWSTATNKTRMERSCLVQPEDNSHVANRVESHVTLLSNGSSGDPKRMFTGVSCLYPWQWVQQRLHTSSSYWHPLRHAAVVAIENSAVRDRHLFRGHIVDNSVDVNQIESSSADSLAKRQKMTFPNDDQEMDAQTNGLQSESARPYLCTGYDIYLVWEPCLMCAMALVHQRIRRIFFAFPNTNAGALGSVQRLQGERSLNHHYAVFRVLLPEEVLDG